MTKEEAKVLLPIITAFAEGKTIQYRRKGSSDWADVIYYLIDNFGLEQQCEYRIKPEPKIVPFDFNDAKDIIGKKVLHIGTNQIFIINGVMINQVLIGKVDYEFVTFLSIFKFEDGSPCGKEIKE